MLERLARRNPCWSQLSRFLGAYFKLVKKPVSYKFGICKQPKYCTLIHSLNLTRTNGKIVTHEKQNITADQIPADDILRQMHGGVQAG